MIEEEEEKKNSFPIYFRVCIDSGVEKTKNFFFVDSVYTEKVLIEKKN